MENQITGKIRHINATEQIKDTFKKRQIVIDTDEQYSQAVAIDFVQDKCDILDGYDSGQSVKVSYNIRGNEYNGKFYVNLQGWRIERTAQPQGAVDSYMENQPKEFEPKQNFNEEEHDDLPFG